MTHPRLQEIKQELKELEHDAWHNEANGGLTDLCKVLQKVIHNFEHKGIKYVIERHWNPQV